MVVLYAARHRLAVPGLARWLLARGIVATLAANVARGWSDGPVGAVVAAWPAASLVGSYELLLWLIRTSAACARTGDVVPGRAGAPADHPVTGLRSLRVILFPPGTWAFLTVGLPATTRRRTRTGFPRSTPWRYGRGGCLLLSRGRRCPPWPDAVPGQRLPLPSGQSLHPAPASHRGGTLHETSTEVHAIHPSGLPVACGPQMRQGPLGVPLCSAPHCYQRRTTGRGRASSTRPELHDRHNRPSNPRVPSQGATSCRNGTSERWLALPSSARFAGAAKDQRSAAGQSRDRQPTTPANIDKHLVICSV
jgi:hypothetical protein